MGPGASRAQRWPRPSAARCAMHPAPCTLHLAPCTLHLAPCTLHLAPCTLHLAPCTSPQPPATPKRPFTGEKRDDQCERPRLVPEVAPLGRGLLRHGLLHPVDEPR